MSVTIEGLEAVFASIDAAIEGALKQSDAAIQGAGINTEAGAKQRAPVDTGRFRAGYQYENAGLCQSTVSNPVEYGIFLELGTVKMAPRPSLFPAYVEAKAALKDELATIPGVTITSWD